MYYTTNLLWKFGIKIVIVEIMQELLEGVARKEGVDFFHWEVGLQFSHTKIIIIIIIIKIKSGIFIDKKSLQAKIFFSVITKNSNQEILTKNLVTFKR